MMRFLSLHARGLVWAKTVASMCSRLMTLSARAVTRNWSRAIAVCTCLLAVAFVLDSVKHSAAVRARGSQSAAARREAQAVSTLAPAAPRIPALRITALVQHGHIVEVSGSTDPGAVVMINGQRASTLFDGNAFRHFLGPLPSGNNVVTVTSQNEHGGVNTERIAVTIE